MGIPTSLAYRKAGWGLALAFLLSMISLLPGCGEGGESPDNTAQEPLPPSVERKENRLTKIEIVNYPPGQQVAKGIEVTTMTSDAEDKAVQIRLLAVGDGAVSKRLADVMSLFGPSRETRSVVVTLPLPASGDAIDAIEVTFDYRGPGLGPRATIKRRIELEGGRPKAPK